MRELGFRTPKTLRACLAIVVASAALLAVSAGTAQAERALISASLLPEIETKRVPGGQIEGACGIAVRGGQIYVSDYYHRAIDIFPNGSERIAGDALDGYCGLAFAPGGALYANEWHEGVTRVLPSTQLIDSHNSTGVAVDQSTGDVYVNDRTYVARYEAPVAPEEPPVEKIGLGNLAEGFGVAVEGGRVYVPDAATDVVKVYEPAADPDNPVLTINGPPADFTSLRDAAIVTDSSNGHVLVLDNLQPGFEFPEAGIDEFSSSGEFLGQLPKHVIDGEPSGLTTREGSVYVTTGNSEDANVMKFGPYVASPLVAPSSSVTPLAGSVAMAGGEVAPTSSSAPLLRLAPSGGNTAQLTATVDSPGTLSTSGRGLVPLEVSLIPGRHVLRLHVSATGKRALARSKTNGLRVRVGVHFRAADGNSVDKRAIVGFKTSKGGRR